MKYISKIGVQSIMGAEIGDKQWELKEKDA